MPKYTSDDIRRIAEKIKTAKDRGRAAHFLVGAGCSISAGIPGANTFVKKIHDDYPEHCKDLKSDDHHSYGACMALLSINERRDLIKPYLENAKINWGNVALAQLIADGFISHVLTVNFDLVLENACGLLGLQPAVYDFGVAPASDAAMVVSPAIIHLHGQSYGLILLNTEEETKKHRDKLRPILTDTLHNAPLVVVGYSGSADGVFQTLLNDFEGRETLYWIAHDDEPTEQIRPLIQKDHVRFLGGSDFDRFMIDLVQALNCWPPKLFSNPLEHLLTELEPLLPYPVGDEESKIDLLADVRKKIGGLQTAEISPARTIHDNFMKGDYNKVADIFNSLTETEKKSLSDQDRDTVFWSFNSAGNLLVEQARRAIGEDARRLFADAVNKYRQALVIGPNKQEALHNFGVALYEQAKRATGEESARLFAEADDKYRQALAIKPRSETLTNRADTLSELAKRVTGDEATRLFTEAADMYRQSLALKPDNYETLTGWGVLLLDQARQATSDNAKQLFAEANEKLSAAIKIVPKRTYNLACLAAIQGQSEKCREYLEQAERNQTLPDADHLRKDHDLDSVREINWFKELIARCALLKK